MGCTQSVHSFAAIMHQRILSLSVSCVDLQICVHVRMPVNECPDRSCRLKHLALERQIGSGREIHSLHLLSQPDLEEKNPIFVSWPSAAGRRQALTHSPHKSSSATITEKKLMEFCMLQHHWRDRRQQRQPNPTLALILCPLGLVAAIFTGLHPVRYFAIAGVAMAASEACGKMH